MKAVLALATLFAVCTAVEGGSSLAEKPATGSTIKTMTDQPDTVPQGITILYGTQDVLREPPVSLLKKNTITTGNKILITNSNIIFTQDDKDFLVNLIQDMIQKSEPSKDGDATLTSAIMAILGAKSSDSKMVAQIKSVLGCRKDPEMMRQYIQTLVDMKKSGDSDDKQEVHHGYGYRVAFRYPYQGRYLYGWRYPLDYWRLYGCKLYPATCGYGHIIGAYYYC